MIYLLIKNRILNCDFKYIEGRLKLNHTSEIILNRSKLFVTNLVEKITIEHIFNRILLN